MRADARAQARPQPGRAAGYPDFHGEDIGARGRDPEFGGGLVDAYQAILSLDACTSGGPPAGQVPVPAQVSQ